MDKFIACGEPHLVLMLLVDVWRISYLFYLVLTIEVN